MARVTGPFMSIDASGTIANTLTASIWKGRNYIRKHSIPTNPNTPAQQAHREKFSLAVAAWQDLTEVKPETDPLADDMYKDMWNLFGSTCQPPISGFNAYVKAYIKAEGHPTIPSSPFIGKPGIH